MRFLVVLFLFLTACGKSVSNGNKGLDFGPTPGAVTNEIKVNLTNYSETHAYEIPSVLSVSENMVVVFPETISTTFQSASVHPVLTILINNQAACYYTWVGGKYTRHALCSTTVAMLKNDTVHAQGIPMAQIITLVFKHQ